MRRADDAAALLVAPISQIAMQQHMLTLQDANTSTRRAMSPLPWPHDMQTLRRGSRHTRDVVVRSVDARCPERSRRPSLDPTSSCSSVASVKASEWDALRGPSARGSEADLNDMYATQCSSGRQIRDDCQGRADGEGVATADVSDPAARVDATWTPACDVGPAPRTRVAGRVGRAHQTPRRPRGNLVP